MLRCWLPLGSLLLLFAACKKEQLQYATVSRSQTYCADPWPHGSTDSATTRHVAHYLDSLRLYAASITIKPETAPELCNACYCKTGKRIYVSIHEPDKKQYKAIGFE